MLASRIPSYHARLRCAGDVQSFHPDRESTLAKITTVSDAISEVCVLTAGIQNAELAGE